MAIRPVDLQMAYLAAPANAAAAGNAEAAPQVAQQTAQSAFAAALPQREERFAEAGKGEANRVHPRDEHDRGEDETERRDREEEAALLEACDETPPDGEHFIDVIA